jgi:hypothetical protein
VTRVACICTHRPEVVVPAGARAYDDRAGVSWGMDCPACCGTREVEVELPEPGTKLERKTFPGKMPAGYLASPALLAACPWLRRAVEATQATGVTAHVFGAVLERYLVACGFDLCLPLAEVIDLAARRRAAN